MYCISKLIMYWWREISHFLLSENHDTLYRIQNQVCIFYQYLIIASNNVRAYKGISAKVGD
jgi:hypothetical protein